MTRVYVDRPALERFLAEVAAGFDRPGRIYLLGETSQVFEGWRERTSRLEYAAEVLPKDRAALAETSRAVQAQMGIEAREEAPGDVIPLPDGYRARARPARRYASLEVYHFDPHSVAFRLIARGDEPDYQTVLEYLQRGWLTAESLQAMLTAVLPRFTNETIQQDPAEFRRKFKGLLQMWQAAGE